MPPSVSRWGELRSALNAVERWLLPGECLLCRAPVEALPDDPLICASCRARWQSLPHPQCPTCGQPVTRDIACRLCQDWPAGFTGVRSAVWLDEAARRAVHLLKYEGWWRVGRMLATAMQRRIAFESGVTLVPIPLGPSRLRSRGYNQSAVLAEALGELLGVAVASGALERRRETTTQTALTPEARRANLAGAFVARGAPPLQPVLVDDVFTTGATLVEAAAALQAAGASIVSGVTFARATRPLAAAFATPPAKSGFWSRP